VTIKGKRNIEVSKNPTSGGLKDLSHKRKWHIKTKLKHDLNKTYSSL
jgi:hypothetical protein